MMKKHYKPLPVHLRPKGWYVAFDVELESFRRLDVMVPIEQRLWDLSSIEILPCKVVMVKQPNGDGTREQLFLNEMISLEGELTGLGICVSDLESHVSQNMARYSGMEINTMSLLKHSRFMWGCLGDLSLCHRRQELGILMQMKTCTLS